MCEGEGVCEGEGRVRVRGVLGVQGGARGFVGMQRGCKLGAEGGARERVQRLQRATSFPAALPAAGALGITSGSAA